ncbi:MAG: hypothetical protein Q8N18_07450 [Opitutaceae bacterium]|nr:hypothetical protein [Opitutaceae bacterium]
MKRLLATLLALLTPSAALPKEEAAHEASTNFDKKHVAPFLERATHLFESGFGPAEVKKVAALMEKIKMDEEKELTFSVKFKGQVVPLRVRLFMDDIDAFDLYIFSSAEVAAQVTALIKKFGEEHGI